MSQSGEPRVHMDNRDQEGHGATRGDTLDLNVCSATLVKPMVQIESTTVAVSLSPGSLAKRDTDHLQNVSRIIPERKTDRRRIINPTPLLVKLEDKYVSDKHLHPNGSICC